MVWGMDNRYCSAAVRLCGRIGVWMQQGGSAEYHDNEHMHTRLPSHVFSDWTVPNYWTIPTACFWWKFMTLLLLCTRSAAAAIHAPVRATAVLICRQKGCWNTRCHSETWPNASSYPHRSCKLPVYWSSAFDRHMRTVVSKKKTDI